MPLISTQDKKNNNKKNHQTQGENVILKYSMGRHFVLLKRSDPGSLNIVFGRTCLHGGAEVRDLGHMQMSCL